MYLVGALYVLYLSVWFYVFIGNKTLYPVLASVAPESGVEALSRVSEVTSTPAPGSGRPLSPSRLPAQRGLAF